MTYLQWHGGNLSYKKNTLKNDASSEITNFQRDLFFKENS